MGKGLAHRFHGGVPIALHSSKLFSKQDGLTRLTAIKITHKNYSATGWEALYRHLSVFEMRLEYVWSVIGLCFKGDRSV